MENLDENQLLEISIQYGEGCKEQSKRITEHRKTLDEPLSKKDINGFLTVFDEMASEPFAVCEEQLDYLNIVKKIYEKEVEAGTDLFLCHFGSVEEILDFIRIFKFKIWRMEFQISNRAETEFCDWLAKQHISIWAVRILLQCYSMKKVDSLVILAIHFLEKKQYQEALELLCDAEKLAPGNEMIVNAIKQVLKIMGETDGQS